MRFYNCHLVCQHIKWKENLKYWKQIRNLKKLYILIAYFVHLRTFTEMSLRGNVHVSLGCTKMWNPRIGTVLHWRPSPRCTHFWYRPIPIIYTARHLVSKLLGSSEYFDFVNTLLLYSESIVSHCFYIKLPLSSLKNLFLSKQNLSPRMFVK